MSPYYKLWYTDCLIFFTQQVSFIAKAIRRSLIASYAELWAAAYRRGQLLPHSTVFFDFLRKHNTHALAGTFPRTRVSHRTHGRCYASTYSQAKSPGAKMRRLPAIGSKQKLSTIATRTSNAAWGSTGIQRHIGQSERWLTGRRRVHIPSR